jgi:hypothetical protein
MAIPIPDDDDPPPPREPPMQAPELSETHANRLTDMISGFFSGKPSEPPPEAQPTPGYPTDEEAEFAKKSGFEYGSPFAEEIGGRSARVLGRVGDIYSGERGAPLEKSFGRKFIPEGAYGHMYDTLAKTFDDPRLAKHIDLTDPQNKEVASGLKNIITRGALAANRDPLATLGFDPHRTVMDVVTRGSGLAGQYDIKTGSIYVNLEVPSGEALVHESIHRGVEMLRSRRPEDVKRIMLGRTFSDEDIARQIMRTVMGDPETGSGPEADKQIAHAKWNFEEGPFASSNQKILKQLQDLAAEEFAKKRPGGPR